MDFIIDVRNLRQLDRIIQRLRQVPGVASVSRK
jgi:(p)ppGpp synthase/HD superfamily hydrolase